MKEVKKLLKNLKQRKRSQQDTKAVEKRNFMLKKKYCPVETVV